jgi:DNA-directed RNA polymerase specialized sigma24 family protein
MIDSLLDDLPPVSNNDIEISQNSVDLSLGAASDDFVLAALPVVQKIVRRKTVFSWQTEATDLVQKIALRLLKWRSKYREKSEDLSSGEWQSFAAKTAYNEINRQFADNSYKDVPLDSVAEIAAGELVEGQSGVEVRSLACEVWRETCGLSLRQRRALLLGSQELVIYFLKIGITDEVLAKNLSLTFDEWESVKEGLPLKNIQIAKIIKEKGNQKSVEAIANSIKKARHEARLKMRRAVEK